MSPVGALKMDFIIETDMKKLFFTAVAALATLTLSADAEWQRLASVLSLCQARTENPSPTFTPQAGIKQNTQVSSTADTSTTDVIL